ncbi:MAG: hypothetical protein MZV64_50090 [Ignavibacteriales bacterium]|nr:hypothetical protein [Ignavibacteriales bacterium]
MKSLGLTLQHDQHGGRDGRRPQPLFALRRLGGAPRLEGQAVRDAERSGRPVRPRFA